MAPDKPVHWTRDKLDRFQVVFLALCTMLAISTGVVGFVAIDASGEAHKALCNFKAGYQEELTSSREFLAEPERFPQFNEPAVIKLTQAKVAAVEDRLTSLKDVNC